MEQPRFKVSMDMQITDPAIIIEILNCKQSPRFLAWKYTQSLGKRITTRTIARIQGGAGPYFDVVRTYRKQVQHYLFQRRFNYDAIQKYYPPPWGDEGKKYISPEQRYPFEAIGPSNHAGAGSGSVSDIGGTDVCITARTG